MYLSKLSIAICLAIVAIQEASLDADAMSSNHYRFRRDNLDYLVKNALKESSIRSNLADSNAAMIIGVKCGRMDCKQQTKESKDSRKNLVEMLTHRILEQQRDGNTDTAQREAEEQVAAVQRAKIAIMAAKGLGDVVTPNDNGLWERDIVLTKEQSEAIIASATNAFPETDGADDAVDGNSTHGRRRRNVYHMESFPAYRWELPIPYRIKDQKPHHTFSQEEHQYIKDAIKDIESKTCVRFSESRSNSALTFYKGLNDPRLCGTASKGRQRFNEIFLRKCHKDFTGVIIHEIVHALGFGHAHNRVDRDEFIDIKAENINPQDMDTIQKNDKHSFTTYGVPYDYYSIMHYGPADLSNNTEPAIVARMNPVSFFQSVMGRRTGGLSLKDAEMIQKVYCSPSCEDKHVWCGWWKHKGYCKEENGFFNLMRTTCMKSCDFC